MPEVRAGFNLKLNLISKDRVLSEVGSYSKKVMVPAYRANNIRVPHLHQKDPSGQWLATWNDSKGSIEVRATAQLEQIVRTIPISGVMGQVERLRWLSNGDGWVVATPYKAWLVTKEEYGGMEVRPLRVPGLSYFEDIRVVGNYLMISTNAHRPRVFLVNVDDLSFSQLKVAGASILSASVTGKGQIVAVVRDYKQYKTGAHDEIVFWSAAAQPQIVERRRCSQKYCNIYNWTPGTQRLAYALNRGSIVLETEDGRTQTLQLDRSARKNRVRVLWQNKAEDKLLAANDSSLAVWDQHATLRWKWSPPATQVIRSAHFDSDDSVLVTTNTQVLRLDQGVVVERLFDLATMNGDMARGTKLEDAVPLNGGAVAFSMVRMHQNRRTSLDRKLLDLIQEF
ncbi:MAG TPA: hypothetical protein EYN06_05725 [Myxococcales bacterium]|nr:hypothetical protein [Myxococcales bacterium]HIN85962.1 hypothetical protein [Myxococcales bacterium]